MILSASDLAALTCRDRPKAQARILEVLGIPFRVHPIDRSLIVSRAVAEKALGGTIEEASAPPEGVYEVDVEGIRAHGKAPAAH